jgi:hypothetical protein
MSIQVYTFAKVTASLQKQLHAKSSALKYNYQDKPDLNWRF